MIKVHIYTHTHTHARRTHLPIIERRRKGEVVDLSDEQLGRWNPRVLGQGLSKILSYSQPIKLRFFFEGGGHKRNCAFERTSKMNYSVQSSFDKHILKHFVQ